MNSNYISLLHQEGGILTFKEAEMSKKQFIYNILYSYNVLFNSSYVSENIYQGGLDV